MAEKLQNIIKIDGTDFEVTAKSSEEAGKVVHALKVNKSGTLAFNFDGSTDRTIDYVPANEGGAFSNAVLIDNKYTGLTEIPDQAIVNFGQINNLVRTLKTAPLLKVTEWATGASLPLSSFVGTDDSVQGLRVVVGNTEEFKTLKRYMGIPDLSATTANARYYGILLAGTSANSNPPYSSCTAGSYNGTYTDVIIPSVGYITTDENNVLDLTERLPVTKIRSNAFKSKSSIKRVVIPKNVTTIESNAFYGCSGLTNVYYEGTKAEWDAMSISTTGNPKLLEATIEFSAPIALLMNSPCLYICTDTANALVDANSKVYLKLPENATFIDLTQGADRLNSTLVDSTNYYTYEGLAEIIARINTRLEALGGEELKVTTTAFAPLHSVDEINNLITDESKKETLNPEAIPSVQSLAEEISNLSKALDNLDGELDQKASATALTDLIDDINDGSIIAKKASADGTGRTISTGYYRSANTSNVNTITVSTSAPSGGNVGDIWIMYE